MNFTQALARLMLLIAAAMAVCLVTVGVLLIVFPQTLLSVILYSAGVVFILMGVTLLIGFLSALLQTKLCKISYLVCRLL